MNYAKFFMVACGILLTNAAYATDKDKKEVLTLSGGKYIEIFDQDSITQIGSVLYNVNSQQIIGFVNSEVGEGVKPTLKPEVMSRWLSIDPLASKFPNESPYCFAGNNPIYYVDKKGLYKVSAENERNYQQSYPTIMKYLATQVEQDVARSSRVVNGLIQTNPNIQPSSVKGIAKWGSGPEIVFKVAPGEFPMEFKGAAGYTEKDAHVIQMNAGYAKYLEGVLTSDASPEAKQVAFTRFYMTLVHETGHELNKYGAVSGQNANGNYLYQSMPNGVSTDEQGYKAEQYIWGTGDYQPFSSPQLENSGPGVQGISSQKYQPGVTEGVIKEANKTEEGRMSLPTVPTP